MKPWKPLVLEKGKILYEDKEIVIVEVKCITRDGFTVHGKFTALKNVPSMEVQGFPFISGYELTLENGVRIYSSKDELQLESEAFNFKLTYKPRKDEVLGKDYARLLFKVATECYMRDIAEEIYRDLESWILSPIVEYLEIPSLNH